MVLVHKCGGCIFRRRHAKHLGHFGDRFGGPLAEMANYTIHLDHKKKASRFNEVPGTRHTDVFTEFFCKNFSCLQEKKKHSPTRSVKSTQTELFSFWTCSVHFQDIEIRNLPQAEAWLWKIGTQLSEKREREISSYLIVRSLSLSFEKLVCCVDDMFRLLPASRLSTIYLLVPKILDHTPARSIIL